MGWSIKLFSLGGTAVRMHLTFLLLVAWIAATEWMRGTPQDALYGVLFILVLFGCVVLHEFGHIWAARRYGIRTPDVTLLPIGGVASMERMPEKPGAGNRRGAGRPGREPVDRGRAHRGSGIALRSPSGCRLKDCKAASGLRLRSQMSCCWCST